MKKRIVIDASFSDDTRVALINKNNQLESIEYEYSDKRQVQGNIYLATITRVEPSLQAAFIDYGGPKHGFLPFNEIHELYYDPLEADKKREVIRLQRQQIATDNDIQNATTIDRLDEVLTEEGYDSMSIDDIDDIITNSELDIDISANELDNTDHEIKHYKIKINEVIKKDQVILVQAIKEEKGNKGAVFTTHISLAGRYCVLMPNSISHNGVSRKISNATERKRLKNILDSLNSEEIKDFNSIVARTVAIGCSKIDIKKDYDYLVNLWNSIRDKTLKSHAPQLIHAEQAIILRAIRDMFKSNVVEIVVQGDNIYDECVQFMKEISPNSVSVIKRYNKTIPLFTKLNLEEQIRNLYQPRVDMATGSYIIINPTEALIAIDVNSGKYTSARDVENMSLKTNLEAAREIAKQLRLRELSGLIVIDFIDMHSEQHKRLVEKHFKECLSLDNAKINLGKISDFGLLELSRQRTKPSLLEMHMNMCNHCDGKGVVRSQEVNAMLIFRTVENEISITKESFNVVYIFAVEKVVNFVLNHFRDKIFHLENKYKIKLYFYVDYTHNILDQFSVEKKLEDIVIEDPIVQVQKAEKKSTKKNNNLQTVKVANTTNDTKKSSAKNKKNNTVKKKSKETNEAMLVT